MGLYIPYDALAGMTGVDVPADTNLSEVDETAPRIEWDVFIDEVFQWNQGDHVGLIAPTDSGKTTLALQLLPFQPYVVVFATKPRDRTLSDLVNKNSILARKIGVYKRLEQWRNLSPDKHPRRLLWPDARDLYAMNKQRDEFQRALSTIYYEGGWCVYLDELWFMSSVLKLDQEVRIYLQQARANDISLMVSSQRPSRIPLEVYDQSRHLFFARDNDRRNLDRIAGINNVNEQIVRYLVSRLDPHEFLYVNNRTGFMCRIICPPIGR
jgi:hypothetical protein